MAYTEILYDVDEYGVCRITFNRPETVNSISWNTHKELDDALKVAEKDDKVRVIILKGAGRGFGTGYQLGGGGQWGQHEPRGRAEYGNTGVWNSRAHVQGHVEYWLNVCDLWKPVIAQVHGYSLGGTAELMCFCDMVVITEDCRFGYPPTRWQGIGDVMAPFVWHAGIKIAMEIAMGRILSGKECYQFGFANYLVKDEKELEEETTKLARRTALIHPESLSMQKRNMWRTLDIAGFRISVQCSGEFNSLGHMGHRGHDYGSRAVMAQMGLGAALRKLNEPWGGI